MYGRFKVVGLGLIVAGFVFVGVGGYTYMRTQEGANSLQAFSAAQDVRLTYNEEGQLVDRGETAGAAAIMTLLTDEWGYTVNQAEFDPRDPLVNTPSEYMFQMATVAYHTLHGTQTVVLDEPVEYNGETFAAGTYEFPVDGRYWSQFDRSHPIEGPARAQAWTGVAHALIAELGVGTMTATTLQMGLGIAALAALLGVVLMLTGIGVIWAARPIAETEKVLVRAPAPVATPA
jgi:hypothetical protein